MINQGFEEISLIKLLASGGPFMWPILLCSVIALAISLEKLLYLRTIENGLTELKSAVFDFIRNNNIKAAIAYCDSNPSPAAKILLSGLSKFGSTKEEIKDSMEEASSFEIPILESRLNALSTISHVCPLLGLLGTVSGMLKCFRIIQLKSTALNPLIPSDLAGGLFESLISTLVGLIVSIPVFIAYNYFASRIRHLVSKMESAASQMCNLLRGLD
ncbi:MAG: MotA/TolQ/ExbB proton channel family protein [Candidatus Omnitrophica bacterium]|nr:MotA/TolQ/ExbB proton channel family protein [Candidatus Omnitrophota bacterium]